ncbi:alpha/beta hydrolase [Streptomyces avermitilis]|uniref:alpha/beta fold hydrolase n=1 Tax=Streptomyces avermitilis TaxID=33903 RepID=UPI0033C187B5
MAGRHGGPAAARGDAGVRGRGAAPGGRVVRGRRRPGARPPDDDGHGPRGRRGGPAGRAQRPDYRALLTRVTVPALVVVGADDMFTPVADAAAMRAALPDATLRVIDGAAHLPNLERPEEFNAALGEFLFSLSGV